MLFTEDDDLNCRWLQTYEHATDSLFTRFDCIMPIATGRGLQDPRQFNHITPEVIEFALEHYADQIEECKLRAREQPGLQFSVNFHITHEEMMQRCNPGARIGSQLRVRIPTDDWLRINANNNYYAEQEQAKEKSIELLKSWLSPKQRDAYTSYLFFEVIGSDTGTRYRLVSERSYNILELDKEGEPTGQKFCVIPAQSVAMGDQLLAQKIWLETDELRTLKIANKIVRTGAAGGNSILNTNMITREVLRMFQNTNNFLRNLPEFEEIVGEREDGAGA